MVVRVIVLVCVWCTVVSAQTPQEKAEALFQEGRTLLTEHNDPGGACAKLEQSIAIDPSAPRVQLHLGLCHEQLERYATALAWFRKARASAAQAQLAEVGDEAKQHLEALAPKVATLRIDASAITPETIVTVGGKLVEPKDYAGVEVDRGAVEITARAHKKQMFTATVTVTDALDAGTVKPVLADEVVPPNHAFESRRRMFWTGGLAVTGVALCVISPLWARSVRRAWVDDMMQDRGSAVTKQHIATGIFVGGLGALGLATYLYLTRPTERPPAVVPTVGLGEVGVSVTF